MTYFKLPALPFDPSQVSSWLSAETLSFHHGRHHAAYIEKLNALLVGNDLANRSLEQILQHAHGPLFDCAAQSWNHTFYWRGIGLSDGPAQKDPLKGFPNLQRKINESFGTLESFKWVFATTASELFGSGWLWLVENVRTGKLELLSTKNAGEPHPLNQSLKPLLTCDVWEHAYYIDYRNSRTKYVDGFLRSIKWDFVDQNLSNYGTPDMTSLMRPQVIREERRQIVIPRIQPSQNSILDAIKSTFELPLPNAFRK